MQNLKLQLYCCCISTETAKIKRLTILSAGWDTEQTELSYISGGKAE